VALWVIGRHFAAHRHVRVTPNSDRESEFPAKGYVRFTPKSGHVQRTSSCLLWPIADIPNLNDAIDLDQSFGISAQ
jgi:hypothetical protein